MRAAPASNVGWLHHNPAQGTHSAIDRFGLVYPNRRIRVRAGLAVADVHYGVVPLGAPAGFFLAVAGGAGLAGYAVKAGRVGLVGEATHSMA